MVTSSSNVLKIWTMNEPKETLAVVFIQSFSRSMFVVHFYTDRKQESSSRSKNSHSVHMSGMVWSIHPSSQPAIRPSVCLSVVVFPHPSIHRPPLFIRFPLSPTPHHSTHRDRVSLGSVNVFVNEPTNGLAGWLACLLLYASTGWMAGWFEKQKPTKKHFMRRHKRANEPNSHQVYSVCSTPVLVVLYSMAVWKIQKIPTDNIPHTCAAGNIWVCLCVCVSVCFSWEVSNSSCLCVCVSVFKPSVRKLKLSICELSKPYSQYMCL